MLNNFPCTLFTNQIEGKDRTGIVVALILMLAGVSDNDIGDEYALTELGLAKWAPRIVQILMKDPALEGDEDKATRMISAKKANMEAFLSRLRDLYGSAEGYLKFVLGFSDEDIAKIKKNIVEPLK
jgi:protein tyrosine/serine phosphatase